MTQDEVQSLFKIRKENDTIIYAWPQDVIDNTIKAWSTSATSATGYGALGAPSGRYFAPANGPDCIETIANSYGDCGARTLVVTGPLILNLDMSVRKTVRIAGRSNFQFILDVFNVLNRTNFVPVTGINNSAFGTQLSNYQAALPNSSRTMQIGTRVSW